MHIASSVPGSVLVAEEAAAIVVEVRKVGKDQATAGRPWEQGKGGEAGQEAMPRFGAGTGVVCVVRRCPDSSGEGSGPGAGAPGEMKVALTRVVVGTVERSRKALGIWGWNRWVLVVKQS